MGLKRSEMAEAIRHGHRQSIRDQLRKQYLARRTHSDFVELYSTISEDNYEACKNMLLDHLHISNQKAKKCVVFAGLAYDYLMDVDDRDCDSIEILKIVSEYGGVSIPQSSQFVNWLVMLIDEALLNSLLITANLLNHPRYHNLFVLKLAQSFFLDKSYNKLISQSVNLETADELQACWILYSQILAVQIFINPSSATTPNYITTILQICDKYQESKIIVTQWFGKLIDRYSHAADRPHIQLLLHKFQPFCLIEHHSFPIQCSQLWLLGAFHNIYAQNHMKICEVLSNICQKTHILNNKKGLTILECLIEYSEQIQCQNHELNMLDNILNTIFVLLTLKHQKYPTSKLLQLFYRMLNDQTNYTLNYYQEQQLVGIFESLSNIFNQESHAQSLRQLTMKIIVIFLMEHPNNRAICQLYQCYGVISAVENLTTAFNDNTSELTVSHLAAQIMAIRRNISEGSS